MNAKKIYDIIASITGQLKSLSTDIYPSIGNHDHYLTDQVGWVSERVSEKVGERVCDWVRKWLSELVGEKVIKSVGEKFIFIMIHNRFQWIKAIVSIRNWQQTENGINWFLKMLSIVSNNVSRMSTTVTINYSR